VPVGRRLHRGPAKSVTPYEGWIVTLRNMLNWFAYSAPQPLDVECSMSSKPTCLKCLGPFLVSPTLKSIVAFNHGADAWGQTGGGAGSLRGALCITFNRDGNVMHFSAVHVDQCELRQALVTQETMAGRTAQFACEVKDLPVRLRTPPILFHADDLQFPGSSTPQSAPMEQDLELAGIDADPLPPGSLNPALNAGWW